MGENNGGLKPPVKPRPDVKLQPGVYQIEGSNGEKIRIRKVRETAKAKSTSGRKSENGKSGAQSVAKDAKGEGNVATATAAQTGNVQVEVNVTNPESTKTSRSTKKQPESVTVTDSHNGEIKTTNTDKSNDHSKKTTTDRSVTGDNNVGDVKVGDVNSSNSNNDSHANNSVDSSFSNNNNGDKVTIEGSRTTNVDKSRKGDTVTNNVDAHDSHDHYGNVDKSIDQSTNQVNSNNNNNNRSVTIGSIDNSDHSTHTEGFTAEQVTQIVERALATQAGGIVELTRQVVQLNQRLTEVNGAPSPELAALKIQIEQIQIILRQAVEKPTYSFVNHGTFVGNNHQGTIESGGQNNQINQGDNINMSGNTGTITNTHTGDRDRWVNGNKTVGGSGPGGGPGGGGVPGTPGTPGPGPRPTPENPTQAVPNPAPPAEVTTTPPTPQNPDRTPNDTPQNPDVAPPQEAGPGPEPEPPRTNETPNPAPPQEQPPRTPETPTELKTNYNVGLAGQQDRLVQNVMRDAQYSMSFDTKTKHKGLIRDKILGSVLYRIPLLGGLFRAALHPVHMIWQNGLARGTFQQMHIRFASDMAAIMKNGVDKSIPVELRQEIIEKAYVEGRKNRGKWYQPKRWYYSLTDTVKGIIPIGQTSEMNLAKKWLKDRMNTLQGQADWSTMVSRDILLEQNALGSRFATLPNGMTVDQANRYILAQGGLETRYDLKNIEDGRFRQLHANAQAHLKGLIEQYARGSLTELQLVQQTNLYLKTQLVGGLDGKYRKEFDAPEMASNILSVALEVSGKQMNPDGTVTVVDANRWARYNQPRGQNEHTAWQDTELTILFGKGEGSQERGKVKMDFFKVGDRLARRLAERNTNLLGNAGTSAIVALAKDFAQDAVFFGAGLGAGGAIFGANTAFKFATAFAGAAVGAGLQESGVGLSGLGIEGFKGRTAQEIEQLSREIAMGLVDPADARIRPELRKALVTEQGILEKASDVAGRIEGLLGNATLTEADARKLLAELAYADARMRLSDMSGQKGINFKVQNYFVWNQDQKGQEEMRLKSALLNGIVKLQAHQTANATFMPGQAIFTGTSLAYGQVQGALGVFEKYSAVMEAQLRRGSKTADDAGNMKKWLMSGLKFSDAEATAMMTQIYNSPDVRKQIDKSASLVSKERQQQWLSIKRGAASAVRAVAIAPVAGLVYAAPIGEVMNAVHDIQHAGAVLPGLGEYINDWNQVLIKGHVPIEVNAGVPHVDLSLLQKAALMAKSLPEAPFLQQHGLNINLHPDWVNHAENIDGVHVNLSPGLRHEVLPGGQDILVDDRTGWFADMSNKHFAKIDVAGHSELVVVDDVTGAQQPAVDFFKGTPLGEISVTDGAPVTEVAGGALKITGHVVDTHTGFNFNMPQGELPDGTKWHAEWVKDGANWDMVVKDGAGADVVIPGVGNHLVENAVIDPSGNVVGGAAVGGLNLTFKPDGGVAVGGADVENGWRGAERHVDHKVFLTNATDRSDFGELQGTTSVRLNSHGNLSFTFDGSHATKTSADGVHFVDVQQEALNSDHGKMHFMFQPGGHSNQIIIDANEGINKLHLDPDDNTQLQYNGAPATWDGPDGKGHDVPLTSSDLYHFLIDKQKLDDVVKNENIPVADGQDHGYNEQLAFRDGKPEFREVIKLENEGKLGLWSLGYQKNGDEYYVASGYGGGDMGVSVSGGYTVDVNGELGGSAGPSFNIGADPGWWTHRLNTNFWWFAPNRLEIERGLGPNRPAYPLQAADMVVETPVAAQAGHGNGHAHDDEEEEGHGDHAQPAAAHANAAQPATGHGNQPQVAHGNQPQQAATPTTANGQQVAVADLSGANPAVRAAAERRRAAGTQRQGQNLPGTDANDSQVSRESGEEGDNQGGAGDVGGDNPGGGGGDSD